MQFLQRSNVGIVAIVERRAKSRACRVDDARAGNRSDFDRDLRGRLQGQLENDGSDGNARTISVSIHIISSEFQGGGSGNGEAWGETDDASMLAHAPRAAARTGRLVRVQRFITPPNTGKPVCRIRIMRGPRHWLKEFLREIRLFHRHDQHATLVVRLEPLIGTQLLREIGANIAQLLVACLLQSLAVAELARLELAASVRVAGRDLEQLLGLMQLLHERIRLLLAAHQVALDGRVLLRPGWHRNGREHGCEKALAHGLAWAAVHSSRSLVRSAGSNPAGSKR